MKSPGIKLDKEIEATNDVPDLQEKTKRSVSVGATAKAKLETSSTLTVIPTKTTKPSTTKTDIKKKEYHPYLPAQKPSPIMASFGVGNVKPTKPSNLLKTFNARAPLGEVS